MTDHVGLDVRRRVLERVPDSDLSAEVDDVVDLAVGEHIRELASLGEIADFERELGVARQIREAVALESHRVVVVQVVDADHLFAACV